MIITPPMIIAKSIFFWQGVSAPALKWNMAGKIKAIGVHIKAPEMDKNLSRESKTRSPATIVKIIIILRVMFFSVCLFFDFGIPA
jgi:hypothetical protein